MSTQGFNTVVSALKRLDKKSRHDWASEQLGICIAKQIADIRRQRGWTQAELGKRCGMTQSYIARLERPSSAIHARMETLCRIAAAFECALQVRFVSWSEFVIYVLTITGNDVNVCRFEDEEFFKTSRRSESGE